MNLTDLYFRFNGRIGRFSYIVKGQIVLFFLIIILGFIDSSLFQAEWGSPSPFYLFPMLLIIYIGLALGVKRAHDLNHSGWFLLWGAIPIIGPLILFINFFFLKGTDGPNQFGGETY